MFRAFMDQTLTIVLTLLLLRCLDTQDTRGQMVGAHDTNKQSSRSPNAKASRCSYTFIVPQQKLTGALCLNTHSSSPNRSEVAQLQAELKQQQEQLRKLQHQLEQEDSLVMEVRALRKESNSMNTRIAQLYAQLLQEVIHKKDQVLEQQRVENLLLNATTQALEVSSNYRELEKKYGALTSTISSQNQFISRLEKQCQCKDSSKPSLVMTEATDSRSKEHHNYSSEVNKGPNDVQRDQSATSLQTKPEEAHPRAPTETPFVSFLATKSPGPWRDCQHVLDSGETTSGIYLIRPANTNRLLQAWCEQSHEQGGWTVIQRRQDGSVNFFRTWEQYKQGFGNLNGEYWLGLEHLYWLSKQSKYKLRVALEDWQGRQVFAEYDSFHLEPESDWYRLRLGQYQGNAGDSFSWHNNKAFTTLDRDKDSYTGNCAHYQKGGWWYHMCAHSNLNGVWYRGGHYRSRFQDGVYWAEFHGGSYSLKKVSMMIKPT
nr:angiopoietin-related protein 6 [Nothobranchius furzeri]